MLEIRSRSPEPRGTAPQEQLRLPFESRCRSRLRAELVSGEAVGLLLARGEVLRGGDRLVAADGRVVEVIAEPEALLHVECDTPEALARAAYHLGNRHVALEVGPGYLRLAVDHVLEHMLAGLGARVTRVQAPFEPEVGAYGAHAPHGASHGAHHDHAPAAKIHEHGAPAAGGPQA